MRSENPAFFATRAARRTADLSQLVDRPESALMQPDERPAGDARQKTDGIRRAAFQKPRLMPILMKNQRNFDYAPDFCQSLCSDRFCWVTNPQPHT
jgi:hypothetical protein